MKKLSSENPSNKQTKPTMSPIKATDKAVLEKTISKTKPFSKNYEDSWGYIIQSTRYNGYKICDPKSNSLLFFGNKSDSNKTPVITNANATINFLKNAIQEIQNTTQQTKVIIKNVDKKEKRNFLKNGFREYTEKEIWDKDAPFDDQTYPQVIIDLEKLYKKRGNTYQHLRTALNKLKSRDPIYIRPYKKTDKEDVLKVFSTRDNKTQSHKKNMYYDSHKMFPDAKLDKYVVCSYNNHAILGFTAISKINSQTVALVAAIFKNKDNYTSTAGTFLTLKRQYEKGYKFANLGGSEAKNMYQFKKEKFIACDEIEKIHLIYDKKKHE